MKSIYEVINYTKDRVWCEWNLGTKNPEQIAYSQGSEKMTKLLKDPTYNIMQDIGENGNNFLHQIVESGIVDLLRIFKNEYTELYKNLSEKTNMMGLTPFDVSKLDIVSMKYAFKLGQGDIFSSLVSSMTAKSYSAKKIYEEMLLDNLPSNGKNIKENYNLYFSAPLFKNIPFTKEFLSNINAVPDEEYEKNLYSGKDPVNETEQQCTTQ